jgi:hypothetical protein
VTRTFEDRPNPAIPCKWIAFMKPVIPVKEMLTLALTTARARNSSNGRYVGEKKDGVYVTVATPRGTAKSARSSPPALFTVCKFK